MTIYVFSIFSKTFTEKEFMWKNGGGQLRLEKDNSDNRKGVSSMLNVSLS